MNTDVDLLPVRDPTPVLIEPWDVDVLGIVMVLGGVDILEVGVDGTVCKEIVWQALCVIAVMSEKRAVKLLT